MEIIKLAADKPRKSASGRTRQNAGDPHAYRDASRSKQGRSGSTKMNPAQIRAICQFGGLS